VSGPLNPPILGDFELGGVDQVRKLGLGGGLRVCEGMVGDRRGGYTEVGLPKRPLWGVKPNLSIIARIAGPLNPTILGDFERVLARKSPRIGGLGGGSAGYVASKIWYCGGWFGYLWIYTTELN
jgi:hypothetical protein